MWWLKRIFENVDFDLFSGLLFFVRVVIMCKLYVYIGKWGKWWFV